MNLAVYNSAIAVGSAVFNGLAAAAVAASVASVGRDGDGGDDDDGGSADAGAAAGFRAVFALSSVACAGAAVLGMLLTRMLLVSSRENSMGA